MADYIKCELIGGGSLSNLYNVAADRCTHINTCYVSLLLLTQYSRTPCYPLQNNQKTYHTLWLFDCTQGLGTIAQENTVHTK